MRLRPIAWASRKCSTSPASMKRWTNSAAATRTCSWKAVAAAAGRIDLETLSRFHWHQKSDSWFNTVTDQAGLCGGNLYLPGGVLNVPTSATDNFGLWSSFAGQLCLAWHPLDKDFPMELAKRQVKLYKRVRPYLSRRFLSPDRLHPGPALAGLPVPSQRPQRRDSP